MGALVISRVVLARRHLLRVAAPFLRGRFGVEGVDVSGAGVPSPAPPACERDAACPISTG